jgi:2-phospho-L-lactate guanylyltransferase
VHAQSPGAGAGRLPRPVTVVVPVRSFEGAKSRLGEALDAEERRELVARLLRRIVHAALATPAVAEVLVVSPDPDLLAYAATVGARPVHQRSSGLNPALREARAAAAPRAVRLLVLPGDVVAVSPTAIEALLAAGDDAGTPSVVVAPDRHGLGTNALLLDPPDVIEPAFGATSRADHRRLAAAAGAAYVEVEGTLGLDVDTPDDLLLAEAGLREVHHVD